MRKKILLLCYAAAVAFYLLSSVGLLCWDIFLYDSGRLVPQALALEDFELYDLYEQDSMRAVSVGNDAQMIYTVNGNRVRSVSYRLQKPASGDVSLYYTLSGQTDFSKKQVLLAPYGETQKLFYKLPAGKSYEKIRLDVSSYAGEELVFENIELNARPGVEMYFSRTLTQWCALVYMPLLGGCFGIWAMDTLRAWREKRNEDTAG